MNTDWDRDYCGANEAAIQAAYEKIWALEQTPQHVDSPARLEQLERSLQEALDHLQVLLLQKHRQARVDPDAFKQVFSQLCQNAVEAMPAGGTLSVRLSNSDTQISLEVADTGIGIPEGVPIFDPWVTTKAQGTGLGLSLVQRLVAAHAGHIRYLSTPGQGTTFTLTLPLPPPS